MVTDDSSGSSLMTNITNPLAPSRTLILIAVSDMLKSVWGWVTRRNGGRAMGQRLFVHWYATSSLSPASYVCMPKRLWPMLPHDALSQKQILEKSARFLILAVRALPGCC